MIRIRLIVICSFLGISSLRAQVPVPDFSASVVSGCGPLTVQFKDLSTGKPFSWTWDFGNNQLSTQQNPNFTFSNPGVYTVSLIVKNASGFNSITKTDYITVFAYPSSNFSADLPVACAPANIQFTNLSSPGQGSITQLTWDFGDGTTSNQADPAHVFSQTGYYDVSLTSVNSGGCSNKATRSRFIRVIPGVQPDFTWAQTSTSCDAPFDINFINQTSGPGALTYNWTLGNNTTSSQINPSTTYPSDNNYTINLTAASSLGCTASTSKTVSFRQNAPVITAPDSACVNSPVSFTNNSSPAPLSSSWDFGDATSSAATNPSKTYTAVNTYTVTLTNTYPSCTASATKTIKIINSPAVAFTADKTVSCQTSFSVNFQDQTPGASGWLWDFGDGGTSTLQNPPHTYNTLGNFNVTLSVTTASGCAGALTKNQFIRIAAPTVSINPGSIQGCAGSVTHPFATVSAVDGVASYLWTASNAAPTSSTVANPAFTFSSQGNFNISLKIVTNGGCTAEQSLTGAVIIGTPTTPVFSALPQDQCAHQPITFTSTSAPVDSWIWNFGDSATSTLPQTVQHQYSDSGYFDVSLTVFHHGCRLMLTEPKLIHINPPIALFTYNIACADRRHVSFIDTSKIDPLKGAPTFKWDFGDGTPPDLTQNPVHDFPSIATYTVTLIVNNGGCADTIKKNIDLQAIIPSFTISPNPACKKSQFTLTSTSTPATSIASYAWTVNAVTQITSAPSFTTSIPVIGTHPITLVVTDLGGCPWTAPVNNIQITGPTAQFTPVGAGGCKNSPIAFTDQSTPYNTDAITSWTFNFGDGNTQTFTAPPFVHNYADTGTYQVSLIVQDGKTCTDTFTVATAARITSPKAGFYARDTLYCPNALLAFNDTSKGSNLVYVWDFGDNSGSTDQNPTHSFTTNGQYYNIKLKVTDDLGCPDSATYANYIHIQKPIAAFTLEDSTGICSPLQTNFTPAGQYYDSLYWDFGDGATSTLDTTAHFYNTYGQAPEYAYKASLILQGAGGCRDTATRNVYLYNPYDLATFPFTFAPPSHCDSITSTFSASPPPYTKFAIYFGDGAVDSSGNRTPTHTYRSLGSYTPILSMQDFSGCIVGVSNNIITVLAAVPFFSANPKAYCDTGTIFFEGLAPSNDAKTMVTWDFGDGSALVSGVPTGLPNDPIFSQTHYYSQPGLRTVSLQVNTTSGCSELYTDSIHVWQTPHPLISTEGLLCTGPIQFDGNLTTPNTDSVTWSWTFSNGSTSKAQNPLLNFPSGPLTAHLTTSVNFGCNDTTSQTVTVFPLPEIKGPKVITTPVGLPVTLPFTYSPSVNSYTWSPAIYLDCTDCPNPVSTPTFNTTYFIKVTDDNNCVSLDTVLIKTICGGDNYFIPNTFSPNNDGVNDVFYPRGKGLHNIQSMRIFNRWGQLIFEKKDFPANSASEGWDGTANGRLAPSDAYLYIIEIVCINAQIVALKGDVTLIR